MADLMGCFSKFMYVLLEYLSPYTWNEFVHCVLLRSELEVKQEDQ